MEASAKKHRFRKGRSATFSIDGFNITIGKNRQAIGRAEEALSVFACELTAQKRVHDRRRVHVVERARV